MFIPTGLNLALPVMILSCMEELVGKPQKKKSKHEMRYSIFSSTGRRPVELMRYPFVCRPAVRLSVLLSVRPSIHKQYRVPLSPP